MEKGTRQNRPARTDDEKWEQQTEHELSKIINNPDILEANKKTILKFRDWLETVDKRPATVWRHVYCYGKLCTAFDKDVNIIEASRQDVENALRKIRKLKTVVRTLNDGRTIGGEMMDDATKEKLKSTLKFMFKHFKGEDTYYPEQVRDVKCKPVKESSMTPEDLVTDAEFAALHKAAKTPRTHAILEILRLPIRPHEILALKRKHLDLDSKPPCLYIPEKTKTGRRRIPLFEVSYLAQYINNYASELEPEDNLFTYSEWSNKEVKLTKRPLTYTALHALIKKLQRRAGVRNHNLYKYRHTAITRLLGGAGNTNVPLSVNQLVHIAGTKSPTLEAVYQHLAPNDLDLSVARAYGQELENAPKPKSTTDKCSRCGLVSSISNAVYCARCGQAFSMAVQLNDDKNREIVKSDLLKAFENPEERENLKVLLAEVIAEQGAKKAKGSGRAGDSVGIEKTKIS